MKIIPLINWLNGLLGQVFGCHGIGICLFDEFEHFLGGQWHHIELWIFKRNCNGMFKKQNRRVTQYYGKSSAPPGITAYLLLLFHIWSDEWRHERLILVHINSEGLKIKQQHAARSSLLVSILCSLVWLADYLLKWSENRTKWKKTVAFGYDVFSICVVVWHLVHAIHNMEQRLQLHHFNHAPLCPAPLTRLHINITKMWIEYIYCVNCLRRRHHNRHIDVIDQTAKIVLARQRHKGHLTDTHTHTWITRPIFEIAICEK